MHGLMCIVWVLEVAMRGFMMALTDDGHELWKMLEELGVDPKASTQSGSN